jgi:hypothetical protein
MTMPALHVVSNTDLHVDPEMTVWIKLGDTEIKRSFSHVIYLAEYLKVFDRDWATLEARAGAISASRTVGDDRWYEITIWFQRSGTTLQDSLETIDIKTGHLFVRVVFESWKKVAM